MYLFKLINGLIEFLKLIDRSISKSHDMHPFKFLSKLLVNISKYYVILCLVLNLKLLVYNFNKYIDECIIHQSIILLWVT